MVTLRIQHKRLCESHSRS